MNADNKFNWHRYNTAENIRDEICRQIEALSAEAINARGLFKIVLAGGTTPGEIYKKLVHLDTDWSKWHLFLGDERCLKTDDAQRNSKMINDNWLSSIDIKPENIHFIKAELGANIASKDYQKLLQSYLPFDLVLNGMGEDGHTASLFPGHKNNNNDLTHAIFNSPKPPAERVSLSLKSLSASHRSFIIITGESKYQAVQLWQQGTQLPVNQVGCLSDKTPVDVFIDQQAAKIQM